MAPNHIGYAVGSLPPRSLEDLRQLQRPTEVPDQGLLCDVLWSDPDALPGWQEIPKGVSYTYGPDIVEQFLRENELDWGYDGYEVSGPRCTLFSVPDYCGEFNNRGAVPVATSGVVAPSPTTPPGAGTERTDGRMI
eukprot:g12014.t1